ncbi:MAG: ferrous iron transporter B, partial [candidate division WOR-3 bacterium]|nr:ferrous iron transporter B [candidate division WOR-3 bacterium]
IGLVGPFGNKYVFLIYFILFGIWLINGLLINWLVKGFSPDLIIEVPPYRLPSFKLLIKKLWYRIYEFLIDALPFVLLGILAVNLLYTLRIVEFIAPFTRIIVTKIWGLPTTAIVPILIGFVRKDVAVAMLSPLNLSIKQLVIGSVILAIFFSLYCHICCAT